jgi:hypothetical protein
MRNKTTKKYKHNNIKTRKIRGGGYFDGITGLFQSTTDTNREISQITELQNKLAQNMQELTSTYKNVYTKVTNLNNKIQNLSQQQGNKSGEPPESYGSENNIQQSRESIGSGEPLESYGSENKNRENMSEFGSGNIQQSRESNESGEPLESYGSGNIQQGYGEQEGNQGLDGGKRKSRRKHRSRKR